MTTFYSCWLLSMRSLANDGDGQINQLGGFDSKTKTVMGILRGSLEGFCRKAANAPRKAWNSAAQYYAINSVAGLRRR